MFYPKIRHRSTLSRVYYGAPPRITAVYCSKVSTTAVPGRKRVLRSIVKCKAAQVDVWAFLFFFIAERLTGDSIAATATHVVGDLLFARRCPNEGWGCLVLSLSVCLSGRTVDWLGERTAVCFAIVRDVPSFWPPFSSFPPSFRWVRA